MDQEKFRQYFESVQKDSQERMKTVHEFSKAIGEITNAFLEYGRTNKEISKNQFTSLHNNIDQRVKDLKPKDQLSVLLKEKEDLNNKIIHAKIQDEKYQQKNLEWAIENIIDPRIKIIKEKIENEPLKLTNRTSTTTKKEQETKEEIIMLEEEKLSGVLPEGFEQIELVDSISKETISTYFSKLSTSINEFNDEPYMTAKNVDTFLKRNFMLFEHKPSGGYIPLNLTERQKGRMIDIVYQFYIKYGSSKAKSKMKYVYLLIWNFELFKDDNPDNLNKRMNGSNRPKNRID